MITKAIIPVAGLGTRFLPATKAQAKEMLPLVDRPVIQYVVEEAVASGIKQIFLITSHTKRAVEDHFDYNFELEYRLRQAGKKKALKTVHQIHKLAKFIIIRQREPRGNGDAILCAKEFVKNEPCAVLFGDDVIDSRKPCLAQLIKVFEKYGDPVIAVKRVRKKEIQHFGSVKVVGLEKNVYQVQKIVEKPKPDRAPSNLGIVGRYIITPELLQKLALVRPGKGKEILLTDAFKDLLKKRPVYACEFEGDWYTFGSKQSFLQANIVFGLKDKEIRRGLKRFLGKIK
ncbi:UTP--glucose-1-phosphate uridylyltransferase GalU [Patescibacteria group bacterium]|nr:UTP--glucose-1-phosphate uridylyltransferase GalU [Patescibacteria group bacterium]